MPLIICFRGLQCDLKSDIEGHSDSTAEKTDYARCDEVSSENMNKSR